jgi:type II secretory pathway pseudopilin PulG
MIGVVIVVAIMLILSTVATQAWVDVLRRDNEAEMIFRAKEIVRALVRYQQDRGTLPTELEQLLEPGSRGQYFIRREYDDPLVPDGRWGLLFAAPGGGIYDPNAPQAVPGGSLFDDNRAPGQPGSVGLQSGMSSGQQGVTGMGIAGVKTLCTDKPFRHFMDNTEYGMMLFSIYDQNLLGTGSATGARPGRSGAQGQERRPPGGGQGSGLGGSGLGTGGRQDQPGQRRPRGGRKGGGRQGRR